MNQLIFSIYDSKAVSHLPPFFLPTKAMALRTFTECANNPEHQFGRHPEDYTLYEHGTFDCDQGVFALADKIAICTALDVKQPTGLEPGQHHLTGMPEVIVK